MGKIKVLIVLGNTGRGGAQTFAVNLLRNIDHTLFQMDFVFDELKGGYEEEIRSFGSRIYQLPRFVVANYFSFAKKWNKLLESNQYDIVHGHVSSSASVYLKIAKKHGAKTLLHSHSAGYRGNPFEIAVKKFFSKKAKEYADLWFSCSDKAAERLFGKNFENDKRYHEIPNAINTCNYLFNIQKRNALREKMNALEDTKVIGHIGSMTPPKNHLFIIDVFKVIHKIEPNSLLLLVGDGPLEGNIKKHAKECKCDDCILFTGNMPNANEFLMAMDVMIFPSLFEGLPVTVVEAQATGLPVLLSDCVTNHVAITNLIKVLSLKERTDVWATELLSLIQKRNRQAYNYAVANSDFEMKKSVKKISELYIQCIERKAK